MRRAIALAIALGFAALAGAGCFEPWPLTGPYRCNAGNVCPDGLTCDDGVCCHPTQEPACRSLVLDGGLCFSGATPQAWYRDGDGDGFGNPNARSLFCARPLSEAWVDGNTDCDDSKAVSYPGAQEVCDGYDNDCDGQVDEGLTPQLTFYADDDGDTFGDPAKPLTACDRPETHSANNADCGPEDPNRKPGAPERCNLLDDDCDGTVDENPSDIGAPCNDGGLGPCAAGTIACGPGGAVCVSNTPPSADICDGEDNNCNGQVDEQPECGGPRSLFGPGVNTGALNLQQAVPSGTLTSTCLRNLPAATADTWSAPSWSGASAYHHLWYAEAPGTRTWDLSKTGLKLYLHFGWGLNGGANPWPWDYFQQPVIYVCGTSDSSFARYVPSPTSYLDGGSAQGGTVSVEMPLSAGAGSGWTAGFSPGLDLKQVKRIEVLVKPRYTVGGNNPSFTITWRADAGFHAP